MTSKQMGRVQFLEALNAYKTALLTGENLVGASLMMHIAKGQHGVPKSWWPMVGRVRREVWAKKAGLL